MTNAPAASRLLRTTLAAVLAASPTAQAAAAPPAATDHLTAQAVAALTVRPNRLAQAEVLKQFPIEVAEAASLEYLGLPLEKIERITAIVEPPMGFTPQYAVVLAATQAVKPSRLRLGLKAVGMQEQEIGDRLLFSSPAPSLPHVCLMDRQTVVAGTPQMLQRILDADAPKRTPLTGAMRAGSAPQNDLHAAVLIQPLKPFIDLGLMQVKQSVPPETHKYFAAAEMINGLLLSVDLTEGRGSQLNAYANSKADADRLEGLLDSAVEEIRAKSFESPQYQAMQASPNQVMQAMAAYQKRSLAHQTKMFRPVRQGSKGFLIGRVEAGEEQAALTAVSIVGLGVALIMPAIQAARTMARGQTVAPAGGTPGF